MTTTSIEIDNLLPTREQGTVGVYRQKIVDRLFSGMLTARFSEIAQKPDAPFMMAVVGRGSFLARTKDEASLSALVKDDGIERGLDALLAEAERVVAVRLHRRRSSIGRSRTCCAPTSAGRREGQPRVGQPRRRVHPQLPRRTRRCRRPTTSTRCTSASCRRSRSTRSTRWPRSGSPIAIASSSSARRRSRASSLPDETKLAAVMTSRRRRKT